MSVKLIHVSPEAEKHIAYCARVSSPKQDNPDYEKLLAYCIKHHHWSIFEMANMCMEINTSRAISPQILRHRSFSFQEFSQRYAQVDKPYIEYEARSQDVKNRQNSNDDLPQHVKDCFKMMQNDNWMSAYLMYEEALKLGVAKESARVLLPMGAPTKLYMNGTIRSWITYINVRTDPSTQKEHRDIAEACKKVFIEQLPVISKALGWL